MDDPTSLRGRRVLVAGGAGFIGGTLVRRLLADGAIVRATLRRRPAAAPRAVGVR